MKFTFKILLLLVVPVTFIYSQSSGNAVAVVSAKLIKGLGTQSIGGNLNFGDIVLTNSSSTIYKNPDEGMEIKISGHPEKNIILTYQPIEINNSQWVAVNGGEEGALSFTPEIEHTSGNASYTNASPVVSGGTYTLQNSDGEGIMYIWIGGNIQINDNQPAGNYSGVFQINISY
jgi:hypothetical protein